MATKANQRYPCAIHYPYAHQHHERTFAMNAFTTAVRATALVLVFIAPAAQAAFKCQGADGKIEYSDRPCATNKSTLDKPNTNKGVQSRAIGNPMEQLEKLFTDYEPRLCEREMLATELDAANRSGEVGKARDAWRARQDKLIELNETMVDFQLRTSKITKAAGSDSAETAAFRKFQAGLKTCSERLGASKAEPAPPAPTKPTTPIKPSPATK